MTDKTAKLKSLNNEKLIDVVKNYRQYGYDDNLRNTAIEILGNRGVDENQLKLTGNFENETYNSSQEIYNSFKQNSMITFICYLVVLLTKIFLSINYTNSESLILGLSIINLIVLISYLIFLIKSFINQLNFFKTIGKKFNSGGVFVYFILGMPFYIFMYFYFRNQMKEEMKLIK